MVKSSSGTYPRRVARQVSVGKSDSVKNGKIEKHSCYTVPFISSLICFIADEVHSVIESSKFLLFPHSTIIVILICGPSDAYTLA